MRGRDDIRDSTYDGLVEISGRDDMREIAVQVSTIRRDGRDAS